MPPIIKIRIKKVGDIK